MMPGQREAAKEPCACLPADTHLYIAHGCAVDKVSLDAAVGLRTSRPNRGAGRGHSSKRRGLHACEMNMHEVTRVSSRAAAAQ